MSGMAESGSLDDASVFTAEIVSGLTTKEQLFDELSRKLAMPSYFGRNWDALSDMLRDLSWIERRTVRIVHQDVPALTPEDDLRIYLSILEYCREIWGQSQERKLLVEFPPVHRDADQ